MDSSLAGIAPRPWERHWLDRSGIELRPDLPLFIFCESYAEGNLRSLPHEFPRLCDV